MPFLTKLQSFGESRTRGVSLKVRYVNLYTTTATKRFWFFLIDIFFSQSLSRYSFRLQYASECVKHLGVFDTQAVVTSACVSPFINGECAVALDDGKLFLWNGIHSSTAHDGQVHKLWLCLRGMTNGISWSLEYPRFRVFLRSYGLVTVYFNRSKESEENQRLV